MNTEQHHAGLDKIVQAVWERYPYPNVEFDSNDTFAIYLRKLRASRKFSMRDLGSYSGVSYATLSRQENELRKDPQLSTLVHIGYGLRLSQDEFINLLQSSGVFFLNLNSDNRSYLPQGNTLGERIKDLRLATGKSQRQLSNQAGIDHTSLSKIERGTQAPSSSTFVRLINGLQASREQLFNLVSTVSLTIDS